LLEIFIILTEHFILLLKFNTLLQHRDCLLEEHFPAWIPSVELACKIYTLATVSILLVELCSKLFAYGPGYFTEWWNLLDAFIVLVAFTGELTLGIGVFIVLGISLLFPLKLLGLLGLGYDIVEIEGEFHDVREELKELEEQIDDLRSISLQVEAIDDLQNIRDAVSFI
jgi:hypothetical protein